VPRLLLTQRTPSEPIAGALHAFPRRCDKKDRRGPGQPQKCAISSVALNLAEGFGCTGGCARARLDQAHKHHEKSSRAT